MLGQSLNGYDDREKVPIIETTISEYIRQMQSDVLTLSFLYDRTGLYLCTNKSFVEMYNLAFEEKKTKCGMHTQTTVIIIIIFISYKSIFFL